MTARWDETWHRLREWTSGQAPSERLAAQVLQAEGYVDLDPSHPLGGPDGKKDALCNRDGKRWIMAVYFPRGQQTLAEIEAKVRSDVEGVSCNLVYGIVFVTNQELRLAERDQLKASVPVPLELFHLERLTTILDRPDMVLVRTQFLGDYGASVSTNAVGRISAEMERDPAVAV